MDVFEKCSTVDSVMVPNSEYVKPIELYTLNDGVCGI